jgi:hypothetical protein
VSPIDKRLGEIERILAGFEREVVAWRPDPHEMTDAEAVEEWRRLCHARPPGSWRPKSDPAQEAAIVAEWRRLTG